MLYIAVSSHSYERTDTEKIVTHSIEMDSDVGYSLLLDVPALLKNIYSKKAH